MPYIKQEDRPLYTSLIKDVLAVITDGPESKLTKGEYFGYFVHRLCHNYIQSVDINTPFFNSTLFVEAKKKIIITAADKAASLLCGNDPLKEAGNLNYVISSILWNAVNDAGYGYRCYLKAMVETVKDNLRAAKFTHLEQKDRVISTRKYIIVCGVLGDVVDEVYRRKTSVYEDEKIAENGDVTILEK